MYLIVSLLFKALFALLYPLLLCFSNITSALSVAKYAASCLASIRHLTAGKESCHCLWQLESSVFFRFTFITHLFRPPRLCLFVVWLTSGMNMTSMCSKLAFLTLICSPCWSTAWFPVAWIWIIDDLINSCWLLTHQKSKWIVMECHLAFLKYDVGKLFCDELKFLYNFGRCIIARLRTWNHESNSHVLSPPMQAVKILVDGGRAPGKWQTRAITIRTSHKTPSQHSSVPLLMQNSLLLTKSNSVQLSNNVSSW